MSKRKSKTNTSRRAEPVDPQPERADVNCFGKLPFIWTLVALAILWISMPPLANVSLGSIFPSASSFPFLVILAWLALIPVVGIVASKDLPPKALKKIWLASWIYWAATLYFIPIPHPALWIGWVAMSLYLSIYIPLFVVSARTLVHRFGIPVAIVVPVAWVGFEYLRTILFTGFGLTLVGHSQFRIPLVIQISDLFGAYTVSFAILFVAACIWLTFCSKTWTARITHAGLLVLCLSGILAYGNFRLVEGELIKNANPESLNVAILQGNIDTVFPNSEEEAIRLMNEKTSQYRKLASDKQLWQGSSDNDSNNEDVAKVQLVIWPEGKFPASDDFIEPDQTLDELDQKKLEKSQDQFHFTFNWMQTVELSTEDPPTMPTNPRAIRSIIGARSFNPMTNDIYNSALLLNPEGDIEARYLKNHRVMFGEYIPFENLIPALSKLTPQGKGLTPGQGSTAFEVDDFIFCPNICFESCVPHLIRRQVVQLELEGQEPDFMVNLSDDGWFYGSSCLDFHMANTLFRAVELRKPTLIAANTGVSAYIDGSGRIVEEGPRRDTAILFVGAQKDGRESLYKTLGDWPVFSCMLLSFIGLIEAFRKRGV